MTPTGIEVERLAISMAAASGIIWTQADQDMADLLRRCANAALVHMAGREAKLRTVLGEQMQEAAEAAWAGARALDNLKGPEDLILRLHRAGAASQAVGRVLGVLAEEETVGDVI